MKKEQLEARKSEIVARLNELKRDVAPVGNRILTFQAIGFIAGGSMDVENQTKMVYQANSWHWWGNGC